jgi:hypothetical protein
MKILAFEAEAILANLPFLRGGLISIELIPLAAYSGFARLFDEESTLDKAKQGTAT